jgi:hypothetical protein
MKSLLLLRRNFSVGQKSSLILPPKKQFNISRPHPWHGMPAGPNPPEVVTAYIEMTQFDTVKYELDKATGFIRVDRP